MWLASRVAALLLALGGALLLVGALPATASGYLQLWDRWDVELFRKIAEFGYDGYPADYPDPGIVAFFPGLPLVLAALHPVLPYAAAGLLVSAVASLVAFRALAGLARLHGVRPGLAVAALAVSPWAVFLVAGYSEALFLALALPSWLAARRGRWELAGALCGAACLVRVTGLFVFAALAVEYALQLRAASPRPRASHLLLLAGPAVVLGYAAYLWRLTGDPLAWSAAQSEVYRRSLTPPWTALAETLEFFGRPRTSADFRWAVVADVVALAVGVVVTLLLARRRRWAEAVYLALSVTAYATSELWYSVGRSTVLWWPAWLLLAGALQDRPRLTAVVLLVSGALAALHVVLFTAGHWVG